MRKAIYVLIVFALLLGWDLPAQAQKPSGELRMGLSTLFDQTFHPFWTTAYNKQYLEPMYDYIIGVNKDGEFDPKPSVAYKWETSPDFLTWTFYIRDGIKFHNGDPLTAEDVKYTIEQCAGKKNLATNVADFKLKVKSVETVPPNKVVLHLTEPWPTIMYVLSSLGGSSMIVPKKYIEKNGDDYFKAHPIGSGPYKLYEWKESVHIKLVAQDSHWRVGVPKYKYLTFKLMPEEGTRAAALQSGELDVIDVGLRRAIALKDAGFKINQKKDGLYLAMMWLGVFRPDFPINKLKVRQALIYAINKDEIVEKILMGQGKVVGTAPCMFTWAIEYKPYPHTPYDPKMARKLLAEAGYPNGFTMYIYSFVTMLPESKIINEAISGYWEAIGVKTKILEMDYDGFKPYWTKHKEPPGPAAFLMPLPNRPVYAWSTIYHSASIYSQTKDPKLDQLIEVHGVQSTKDKYIDYGRRIMDYVLENFYNTGICTTHQLYILSNKVPTWEMGKGVGSYRWEYIGLE
jgi:peptide/nickel transport system substrate-binding protein